MTPESHRRDEELSQRPRKRAKYTQIACRPVASTHESDFKDDQVSTRFRTVDMQLEALQREMWILSARLRELESTSPSASSRVPVPASTAASGSTSNTAAAGALHRILNPPKSPSYVGPTSAEFGLGRQGRSVLPEHENDNPDDDEDLNLSTAAPSSPGSEAADGLTSGDPLKDLGLEETLRLVQVYEDTVGIMYPCVDLASLRTYVVEHYDSHHSTDQTSKSTSGTSDQDWFHARDIQLLKILIATALLVESHGRSERAAQLADSVEDRFASRLKVAQVDMKEILILTLLSIFHSYRDDEVIAWRLTGMAARGSMELGLHCQETWQKTGGVFPGALEWMWASRLFWCIYVLDRKWSFGTGLPFAIQDSDMDTNLPEPGHSTPYLTCMISYARLSTKIWGLVVGWHNRSREATSERCASLDAQVQQWVHSIPRELRFDPSWRSPAGSENTDRAMMLQVLLALQANQLRILVYRQNLLSSEQIQEDLAGASTAVETAKSTIHMLDYFSRISNVYFQRPEPFNYFLISALAALFLAVVHAPGRFSHICRPEFYTAVDMVRRSATRARTSRRLQKIIRSLKEIQLTMQWQNRDSRPSPTQQHRASNSNSNPKLRAESHPQAIQRRSEVRGLWGSTSLSSSAESPSFHNTVPSLYHTSGIPTPQASATFWPRSPGTTAEAESNSCEDLSSFFEIAGDLYFDPRSGTDLTTGVDLGLSHSESGRFPIALDAFQAEDEALTRVMAGLL
ncbi:uncharacterized protein N7459_000130 [Penicillium hispanicum]|uniref:uncharacterized protein n=1 Tax=Penicillium hispanicum TaxID=1080232 RepID=UPI0025408885|nr:uncharacterized protein N7459_000130 [Penicillium hispanicum]KAJ5593922.1 hypothetical protein N7459_000130 [Penicillium hispanicum]